MLPLSHALFLFRCGILNGGLFFFFFFLGFPSQNCCFQAYLLRKHLVDICVLNHAMPFPWESDTKFLHTGIMCALVEEKMYIK